jgi:hypothetical protein
MELTALHALVHLAMHSAALEKILIKENRLCSFMDMELRGEACMEISLIAPDNFGDSFG